MIFRRDRHAHVQQTAERLDPHKVTVGDRGTVLPLVLVLDTSLSMQGDSINAVNDTLVKTAQELHENPAYKYTVSLATVTFGYGGVTPWRGDRPAPPGETPFVAAAEWNPPRLEAGGVTPLVEAITVAVNCVEDEKQRLRERRRNYNRPVMWLWSDGEPTDASGEYDDSWTELIPKLSRSERKFRLYALYPPAIQPRGKTALDRLTSSAAWPLEHFEFQDVLPLLSASMSNASADPRDQDDEIQRVYDSIVMGRSKT